MQQPQRARGGRAGRGGSGGGQAGRGRSGGAEGRGAGGRSGGADGRGPGGRVGGAEGRGSGGRAWGGDSRRIVAPTEPSNLQHSDTGGRSGGGEGRGSVGRAWGGDSRRIVAPAEPSILQPSDTGGRSGGGEGRGLGGRAWGGDSRRIVAPAESSIVQPSGSGGRSGGGEGRGSGGRAWGGDSLSKNLQQRLTIEPAASPVAVTPSPSSSKSNRPPPRPGFGTIGRKVTIVTNHLPVQFPHREIFHYDVAITPEVQSKAVKMSIIQELVKLHGSSQLSSLHPVYDRSKNLYTAGALPFTSKEFVIDLEEEGRNARKFQVAIKLVGKADLTHLHQFLTGRHLDEPKEAIHALDVVLRQSPSLNYVPAGRSFFAPSLGGKGRAGDGIEYWMGFYSSLRPTQMGLTLNIDISATSFFEPILVSEYVYQNVREGHRWLESNEFKKVKIALKGLKVQVTHRGDAVRRYRINGITVLPAKDLKFSREEKDKEISVVQYFAEQYKIRLKHPELPCVMAGSEKKPIHLPMEVCKILAGQRYTKKLNERQVQALLKATCRRPHERERSIRDVVDGCNHANDKFIREFGITVSPEPCTVEARVLPPPMLKYSDSGQEKQCQPNLGQWNMNNKRMVNGGRVNHWGGLNLSKLDMDTVGHFCRQLGSTCQEMGMFFNPKPLVGISSTPEKLGQALAHIQAQISAKLKASNERFQLLIVVLPEFKPGQYYGEVKRICETSLGIVTQCCLPKNVLKCGKAYFENLALKVNVKVNGRNTVLLDSVTNRLPLVTDVPTIIFGADVTHPAPGDDSSSSIAAVVASMDWPEITNYRCLLSAQTHRKEMITDLYKDPDGGMIRDHLSAFSKRKNVLPKRIIFYRDGVSEGQFNEVLLYEMDAIRKACQSFMANYLPPVTFVVVQKRHHTRFFPRGRDADRSGNILPGTVVDTKICHPTQFDFYLCSHAGIQGTSRPTHYHVLYDENHFTADNLQMLTNKLCYTYNRCTRSVSVVPPAYYAHLAAARARHYVETCGSDKDSTASGVSSRASYPSFTLPPLADNVKDVMFYC